MIYPATKYKCILGFDYALANAALQAQVVDVTEWHINADEPPVLDYNEEYKSEQQIADYYSAEPYRASDHDPVIVQLDLLSDLLGDFNGNGLLDRYDLRALIRALVKGHHKHRYHRSHKRHASHQPYFDPSYDLNEDGQLNREDLRVWLTLWKASH